MKKTLELGRRLREGTLSKEERAAMKTEPRPEGSLEAEALRQLDAIDLAKLDLTAAVEARDAAETYLVVLGELGDVEAERRVASRIADFDAKMLARRDEWGTTAVAPKDPWFRRIASLDASPWWLDLVALERAFRSQSPTPMSVAFLRYDDGAGVVIVTKIPGVEVEKAGETLDPFIDGVTRGALQAGASTPTVSGVSRKYGSV